MKKPSLRCLINRTLTALSLLPLSLMALEPNDSPIVIAHRGASGYLPEHTLAAYTLAHSQGADYIEQDLVLTRDGHLICLHDLHLDPTTNVETVFPERKRKDGHWYAIDFTLAEIKTLSVHERLRQRFPQSTQILSVPTFIEAVQLIQGLNQSTGRTAGIYPELKQAKFHRQEDQPIEAPFLAALQALGYFKKTDEIYIQSFEFDALKNIRALTDVPYRLIYLINGSDETARKMTGTHLSSIGGVVQGIGPSKSLFSKIPDLVSRAHMNGLKVHPYTFRADEGFPNGSHESFELELKQFILSYKADGLFTDFPDQVRAALNDLF